MPDSYEVNCTPEVTPDGSISVGGVDLSSIQNLLDEFMGAVHKSTGLLPIQLISFLGVYSGLSAMLQDMNCEGEPHAEMLREVLLQTLSGRIEQLPETTH